VVDFLRRRSLGPHAADLEVDGIDRAPDIRGIYARADHQRPVADTGVETAECVVGHALTLAYVIAQTPAEAVLSENVVHHPVGVVTWIEPSNRDETICDVGLRFAGHV